MEKVKGFKFVYEGQDCKVKLVYRGKTTIALIIIGKEDMTGQDRWERVYAGASSCDPRDTYDVLTGIKLACRSALGVSEENDHCVRQDVRRSAIYRSIRMALNPKPWNISKEDFAQAFDTLPLLEKAEHHI